jgi:hypothetical protein
MHTPIYIYHCNNIKVVLSSLVYSTSLGLNQIQHMPYSTFVNLSQKTLGQNTLLSKVKAH